MNVLEKIRKLGKAKAYLFTSQANIRYACGFTGDSSELLVAENGAWFFTDSRYTLQAEQEIGDAAQVVTTSGAEREHEIAKVLRAEHIDTLGIEKSDVSLARFERFKDAFDVKDYADVSADMLRMRAVKTEDEINKIKRAMQAGEAALTELIRHIRVGASELDIRAELLYQINKQGMDSAFDPIVAAGENSALPHARPSEYVLRQGDLLTLDFGCRYMGYCSDMTRTFAIGQVDGRVKKIYDIVKEAQARALAASQAETSAKSIDAAARGFIAEKGFGAYFGHGTGHGVGLEIHEWPVLNAASADKMQKNMVFTVEPGIYVPGEGGVRIEDTCVYGQGSLNSFSKELIFIE